MSAEAFQTKAKTKIIVEIKLLNYNSQWRLIIGLAQQVSSRALCAAVCVLM